MQHSPASSIYFSTQEVANRTGVSIRKLQWRDERGWISPPRRRRFLGTCESGRGGRDRCWTPPDLLKVHIIDKLHEAGVPLSRIRRALPLTSTRDWNRLGQQEQLDRYVIFRPDLPLKFTDKDQEALDSLIGTRGAVGIRLTIRLR